MKPFSLSSEPLDPAALAAALGDPACGGYASFEGWVRERNEGREVVRLDYQAYPALALKSGAGIVERVRAESGATHAACVHRVGELEIGELAVWVGVSAPHRDEAFAACRRIIDRIKLEVPIWKKEHYRDGDSGWVNCERCAHEQPHEPVADHLAPDYSRQTVLPEIGDAGQRRLAAARVLVIGAGGLGSPVLSYLAAAGVGTLGVVDPDRLEPSNLHRQVIYARADVGRPKVELARARLRGLNPAVRVETYAERLGADTIEAVFRDYDLIIDCVDNFGAKFLISDAGMTTGTPVISASVYQYEGQLQLIDPERDGACLRCIWPDALGGAAVANCAETGVIGPVPGVFGALQAMEAVKLLLDLPGRLENELLIVDLLSYRLRRIGARRREDCPVHDRRGVDLTTLHPESDPDLELSFSRLGEALQAGYQVVDVREAAEIAAAPLAGVDRIPLGLLEAGEVALPRRGKYLILCSRGVRSRYLAQRLREQGLDSVYSLRGGAAALAG